MDERRGLPPAAIRWNLDGDRIESKAFQEIVAASRFKVVTEHVLPERRERLRPDSMAGRAIMWSEDDHRRSHLLGWREEDAIVLIKQDGDTVGVTVANNDLEAARRIIEQIDRLLPREAVSEDRVLPIAFWHRGDEGPEPTVRKVEVTRWADIAANYPGKTKTELSALMDGFKPDKNDGRLLLWHGEPGTGKTFAIRALAWAWKEWCRFEYVIDPEQLFGSGSYLTEVALDRFAGHYLFEDNPSREKWRLLIVEDSGEMIAMDAKNEVGQGLSRLLNLSDGILGQGTKILILVTANEELGKLNPAIRRHGRCLSEVEFRHFAIDEAVAWLRSAGCDARANGPLTLSELYALREGRDLVSRVKRIGFRPAELGLDCDGAGVVRCSSNGSA
ncbi:MAG: DUF5925 domain-containing protein [Candidatus Binataceae bacterium]